MNNLTKIIFSIILTISVLLGAYLAFVRHNIESKSMTVELAMDYNDLKLLSSLDRKFSINDASDPEPAYKIENISLEELLDIIKNIGIVSIGLKDETLKEANVEGEIYYTATDALKENMLDSDKIKKILKKHHLYEGYTYFITKNSNIAKRIGANLSAGVDRMLGKELEPTFLEIYKNSTALSEVGIGLSEKARNILKNKGFRIIPRIWNNPNYTTAGIVNKINLLNGYDTIIFDGEDIAGYPENIIALSKALKANNIKYGNIEIIKQSGDSRLKALMGTKIVRVHSIPENEMKKLNKEEAVARLVRAVKERGIRLLYLRPFLPPELKADDPVKYNLDYLSEISGKLRALGFTFGSASTLEEFKPAGLQIIILGAGVVVGFILLLNYFIKIPWVWSWIILLFSIILMPFILVIGEKSFLLEKLLAMSAAVIFPSYAVISRFQGLKESSDLGGKRNLLQAICIFFNILADTALGIIIILGLLANTVFMMGSEVFMGIKIVLILPILIVGAYFFFKTENGFDIKGSKNRIIEILKTSIPVWALFTGLALLGVLFVFVARSGNFTLPVPGIEKTFRLFLEKVLVIRPRTKEFLIGYPLLIISAFLFLKGKIKWLPILLAIGTIGPVSLLNTYCHIHTPIVISMQRSGNGIVFGLVIGLITYENINFWLLRIQQRGR